MAGTLVKSIDLPGNRKFSVVIYDLLYKPVDCIVNAANGGLSHGGAVVTTTGKLSFKGVIHAVGPMMGTGDEENKIVKALHSPFLRASEKGWASLSFPGISSGIFAVPHDTCARAYVRAVKKFFKEHPDSSLTTVRLCLLNGPLLDAVKKELQ